jgi:hypothetical protein
MSDGDESRIIRSIAGDIADASKELTGLDLRMVQDPEGLIHLQDLREWAEQMGKGYLEKDLDRMEKRIRAIEYIKWKRALNNDLSKLGTGLGNIDEAIDINEVIG